MTRLAAPLPTYANRRSDCVVVNSTWDREAFEILRKYCAPGRKATGRFLTRLLYEHDARMEERRRLQQVVQHASDESIITGRETAKPTGVAPVQFTAMADLCAEEVQAR
jgi:hypothetical protein